MQINPTEDLKIDLQQAEDFLSHFPNKKFFFAAYYDVKGNKKGLAIQHPPQHPPQHFPTCTFDSVKDKLVRLNNKGYGIFFCTQHIPEGKRRRAINVENARCVFQDDDDGFEGNYPIKPSLIVNTSAGKYQRYWLTDQKLPVDAFASIMNTIVDSYGGDPNAKDIVRVLRIAGFYHCKDMDKRKIVTFVRDAEKPYTIAELAKAFPAVKPTKLTPEDTKDLNVIERLKLSRMGAILEQLAPMATYKPWLTVMQAVHHCVGGKEAGLKLAIEWLRPSWDEAEAAELEQECRDKYKGFGKQKGKPYTMASLYADLKESGKYKFVVGESTAYTKEIDVIIWVYDRCNIVLEESFNLIYVDEYPWDNYSQANIMGRALADLKFKIPDKTLTNAIHMVANANRVHKMKEYFEALPAWDGKPRIKMMAVDLVGEGSDTVEFTTTVLRKWLMSGVGRTYHLKENYLVKGALVLSGGQNARKSAVGSALCPTVFHRSTFMDTASLRTYMQKPVDFWASVSGMLISELAEFDGNGKDAVTAIKALLSSQDNYGRAAYARQATVTPYTCIWMITTNEDQFLHDPTGSVRFMTVTVRDFARGEGLNTDFILKNRDQIWAEAKYHYDNGENHWLDDVADMEMQEKLNRSKIALPPRSEELLAFLVTYEDDYIPTVKIIDTVPHIVTREIDHAMLYDGEWERVQNYTVKEDGKAKKIPNGWAKTAALSQSSRADFARMIRERMADGAYDSSPF